ncbi:MAG TPA: nucleoside triphosphate pyrophosphohydrolase family protein [Kiritimatiellia bacterium]|nr:nucleoside triphosphate pyrophosphohydrolase family protein [Kiritimatiellia bacterium]
MKFSDYQAGAAKTAVYPGRGEGNWVYPALGLAGESGEICEKIKKCIRDDGGKMTDERRTLLAKELGDVLWYVATLASELGLSMDDIATGNLAKLAARKTAGTLHGSGDLR